MKIQESAENYLESILMIKEEKGYVRSIDIASKLGVSKPSVSFAMKQFRENGYILMNDDGEVTLTEKGMEIAQNMYNRHKIITRLLETMGVDGQTAYEDACRIEHAISDTSYNCIKSFLNSIEED